jgi:hypothetical protein
MVMVLGQVCSRGARGSSLAHVTQPWEPVDWLTVGNSILVLLRDRFASKWPWFVVFSLTFWSLAQDPAQITR